MKHVLHGETCSALEAMHRQAKHSGRRNNIIITRPTVKAGGIMLRLARDTTRTTRRVLTEGHATFPSLATSIPQTRRGQARYPHKVANDDRGG